MKRDDFAAMPLEGARQAPVVRWRDGQRSELDDWLTEEVPVALEFNGISHAVMLATPLNLEDFALGFGLTEGLLERPDELYDVELVDDPAGLRVEMEVSSACFARLKDKRRSMAGRTGCGLCGTESLEQVEPPLRPLEQALLEAEAEREVLEIQRRGQHHHVRDAVEDQRDGHLVGQPVVGLRERARAPHAHVHALRARVRGACVGVVGPAVGVHVTCP